MNRRDLLRSGLALLACVPVLKHLVPSKPPPKAAPTTPDFPPPFDRATNEALNAEAARRDDVFAQMFDPSVKWCDGDKVWFGGRVYEYRNGWWFGRSATRECDPPTITFSKPGGNEWPA